MTSNEWDLGFCSEVNKLKGVFVNQRLNRLGTFPERAILKCRGYSVVDVFKITGVHNRRRKNSRSLEPGIS